MFTGIVTDIGRVRSVRQTDRDRRYEVETPRGLLSDRDGKRRGLVRGRGLRRDPVQDQAGRLGRGHPRQSGARGQAGRRTGRPHRLGPRRWSGRGRVHHPRGRIAPHRDRGARASAPFYRAQGLNHRRWGFPDREWGARAPLRLEHHSAYPHGGPDPGRGDLRDHQGRRRDGADARPDRLRPAARPEDRHHRRPDRLSPPHRALCRARAGYAVRERPRRSVPHGCLQGHHRGRRARRPDPRRHRPDQADPGAHAPRRLRRRPAGPYRGPPGLYPARAQGAQRRGRPRRGRLPARSGPAPPVGTSGRRRQARRRGPRDQSLWRGRPDPAGSRRARHDHHEFDPPQPDGA
uniref:LSM14 domain-containing protein n=1 Tax=Parastrongyloides trichosuri TaxID=131310 RepID=A0A0N4ZJ00_PARTI